jgi:hypothetical protein
LFLRVDDFDASYGRMIAAGVRFVSPPRAEAYGKVAVFIDLEGNRWDLLGPEPTVGAAGQPGDAALLASWLANKTPEGVRAWITSVDAGATRRTASSPHAPCGQC